MRPAAELQRLRSVGRIAAVASGASLAVLVVSQHPGAGWFAALVVLAVSAAAATRTSRWYISGGFTTFPVFVLLLYADPAAAGSRLGERIGETVLGVAIAYAFGLGIPLLRRVRTRRQSEAG